MKKLFNNVFVKILILVIVFVLGRVIFADAQSLSCNNEVNLRVSNDTIYVTSDEITIMPMIRYEFVFYLENNKNITLVYVPNSFNGDVSVNIPSHKKTLLKKYKLERLKIYSPIEEYTTNNFSDKRYFIKSLR